jgi:hypothetical protein
MNLVFGRRIADRFTALALSKSISKKGPLNRRSLHCAPPDFLWRAVALIICMRLSLQRAAHVFVASSAK